MSEIIDIIKKSAHQIAEDYLLIGSNMTDALINLYESGAIDNEEILKRTCEQANQNVYLSLFHNPEIDKSNIQFNLADFGKVKEKIHQSEQEMKEYTSPPKDFRSSISREVSDKPAAEVPINENIKLAAINQCETYRSWFKRLYDRIELIKQASVAEAENSFNKMAYEAKLMIANGESIGDIAKIASRYVNEDGLSMEKVAKAYDIIHRDLVKNGFHVKTEFTKTSSYKINPNAEILKPIRSFSLALEKISAADEMCAEIKKRIDAFDSMIKSSISEKK